MDILPGKENLSQIRTPKRPSKDEYRAVFERLKADVTKLNEQLGTIDGDAPASTPPRLTP